MTRDLIERLHCLWSTGDVAVIPAICAPDFVGHVTATLGPRTLHGHNGVSEAIGGVHHAFTGYTENIDDMIIEGDKVVTRYVCTGTHIQQFLDMPPTGQPIRADEISIFHVRGGLVVEQWRGKIVDG
jgi:predicted ester cyclase